MTWVRTRLKHLCVDAGQYGLNVSANEYSSHGHRLIRTSDIDENGVLRGEASAVHLDGSIDARHRLTIGDLLLSRSGTVGRAMLITTLSEPSTFAGYLVRFRPRLGVEPAFLRYVAESAGFRAAIAAESTFSTIQNFNAERYANIALNVPDLDEQRRIAAFLAAQIERIDGVVRQRHRQVEVLDELSRRSIDSRIARTASVGKIRLGYLAAVQSGVTVDGSRKNDGDSVTLPYLRVVNVQVGQVVLDDMVEITLPRATAASSRLRAGDVLMTEGGDLDKLGRGTVWRGEIAECLHQNHVFAVRPHKDRLAPEYLSMLTRSSLARQYFESTGNRTTNLASTSSSKIRDFRVPLPDVSVQRQIVADIEARLNVIAELKDRLTSQLALLAERRHTLITAAVTGQIDISTASGVNG